MGASSTERGREPQGKPGYHSGCLTFQWETWSLIMLVLPAPLSCKHLTPPAPSPAPHLQLACTLPAPHLYFSCIIPDPPVPTCPTCIYLFPHMHLTHPHLLDLLHLLSLAHLPSLILPIHSDTWERAHGESCNAPRNPELGPSSFHSDLWRDPEQPRGCDPEPWLPRRVPQQPGLRLADLLACRLW